MAAPAALPPLRYRITVHAVNRYIERVRPELQKLSRTQARNRARRDMRVLMAAARHETTWPAWVQTRPHDAGENSGFLAINESTLFVLSNDPSPDDRVVVTVLTRRPTTDRPPA